MLVCAFYTLVREYVNVRDEKCAHARIISQLRVYMYMYYRYIYVGSTLFLVCSQADLSDKDKVSRDYELIVYVLTRYLTQCTVSKPVHAIWYTPRFVCEVSAHCN